ncbi:MAG TPA: FAD-dependent oxidoreductase [Rhodospirillales bacterium]|nr:FAD-dependent oxidoreductase [Rhodospirillales bacterium]
MPRDYDQLPRRLDVAVIGTGVAGLSAAWLLSKAHNVSVYEQDGRVGGHSNTVFVPGLGRAIAVDTGFIVYNELNYPNLTALFAHLGVETQESEMSFGASLDGGSLEYSGSNLVGLFGQRRNLVRPRFWRMLRDILRFYRKAPAILAESSAPLSLGAYLEREHYSDAFIDDHLLPMAAAIWSTDAATMRDHPAQAFVRFCLNHGLMRVTGRPQWRTVTGGSQAYVKRLTASFGDRITVNARVSAVNRTPAGVIINDANGAITRFDHVVVAAHADQALAMLADPSDDERRLLGAFHYSRNTAILHRDEALMPKRKGVWSSWNYIGGTDQVCVTYWMNRLQNLDPRVPLFVTLNPTQPPARGKILRSFQYDHPMYDAAALEAQGRLDRLQGRRNTWYCGSYFGAGFHEDALSSGLAAAELLGGVTRPWLSPMAEAQAAATADVRSAAE